MPGSSMVGSLMREILPSSEVWPGHGRCRIVPHSNEVLTLTTTLLVSSAEGLVHSAGWLCWLMADGCCAAG